VGSESMEGIVMYLRIGNKLVEATRDKKGTPVVKARAETIKNPDGTQKVIVHVPCLKIRAKKE